MIEKLPTNLVELIKCGEGTTIEYKEAKNLYHVICLKQFVLC